MEPIIRLEHVWHVYGAESERPIEALRDICLDIYPGEYLAIIGRNGSGKSTLAKHLNGILLPTRGDVWVKGWNTRDPNHKLDIRSTVGMVFQNPDNQIVATIVEEDVAFGPENLGVPYEELRRRVDWALELVDMRAYRYRPPHHLSGGQKQRVAIAGIMAMKPEVLVLDESTALLDPRGRHEILDIVQRLHREEGITVVAITHFMEEVLLADRVIVLDAGRVVMSGSPQTVFSQPEQLRHHGLDVPPVAELAHRLHRRFPEIPEGLLHLDELVAAIKEAYARIRTPVS